MNSRMKFATLFLLAGMTLALGLSSASAGSRTGHPRYLAAGDSATYGRRASDPEVTAYVPLLADFLSTVTSPGKRPPMPDSRARWFGYANTARLDDETSTDMLTQGQLEEAEEILNRHNQNGSATDDVRVVTFTIGANDIRGLLTNTNCNPTPTPACQTAVEQTLATTQGNLQQIMSRLRAAAGPDTVIATMTYYNPLQGQCAIPGPLGVLAPQVLAGLNAIIVQTAVQYDILVAPVADIGIGVGDLYGDCVHPNDNGYAKIADAFADVIEPELP